MNSIGAKRNHGALGKSPVPATPRAADTAPPASPSLLALLPRVLLTLAVFVAPLKFGTVTTAGEVALFPSNGWEWFLSPWPPFLAPTMAGVVLLAAVALLPVPIASRRAWLVPGAWLLCALVTAIGFCHTTEWDSALLLFAHGLGVAAFAAAAFWILAADRDAAPWVLAALVAGSALSAASGLNQVWGGGLADTLAYVQKQAAENGQNVHPDLMNRLVQHRAFGPFVYPNSFAAHLILTLPVTVVLAWRAGGFFQPTRISRPLFAGSMLFLLGAALWLSGSRAAMLAFGAGGALAALLAQIPQRWKWAMAAGAILAAAGLLAAVNQGRKLESLGARLEYYRAAVVMFTEHPVAGVGLGEFFPHYMRLKSRGAEETRQPHSMLLGAAAQCGSAGALAVLGCLALPFLLSNRRATGGTAVATPNPWLVWAVQAGLLAWGLHAQADFDSEIPGTVFLVAILPLTVLLGRERSCESSPAMGPARRRLLGVVAVLLAGTAMTGIWRWPGEQAYQALSVRVNDPAVQLDTLWDEAVHAGGLLPFSPYPFAQLGSRAAAQDNHALALRAYAEASRRTPHRAAFHLHVAEEALSTGELRTAETALRQAHQWYPYSPRLAELQAHRPERKP